ncbi:protein MpPIWIa [Marchantia polymorpha subsp. ruderalis]|uniref:Piwi domain-containing protein n=2 Tax=Marchantia polymorpha TaxID=3197 RepID=A0AAF6AYD0_MARPO|nr:hypothetical protein MARPO_0006s0220 [Marchantia polymorpha]BBN04764.1 hypothetical protein Mp_3g07450 [Marchantia polymorpha subsp. ruderalis]|eukprot:PTQ48210.1 hypothetical protein MARPO_0006s0220 [Marchantia polymorpha]
MHVTRESGRGGPDRRDSRESRRVNPYPPPDRRNSARDGESSSGARDSGGQPPEPLGERWALQGIGIRAVVEGRRNPPPEQPMAAANPAGNAVDVNLPESEQYNRMRLRGGTSFISMKEEVMRNLSCYYPGFFNKVLPIQRVEPYKLKPLDLLTNYFELKSMAKTVFVHKLTWEPDAIGKKTGHASWRVKAFWRFNEEAKARWRAQGYESKEGLGIWDRGGSLFRTEALDPERMATTFHTRAVMPQKPHMYYKEKRDLTLNIIKSEIIPDSPDYVTPVLWADQELYRRVGFVDYRPVRRIRDAVAAILQGYYVDNFDDYIEDTQNARQFCLSGYPHQNDPRARFVKYPSWNVGPGVRDAFVLRRGSRSSCSVLASGVYINISTATGVYWAKNVSVADVIRIAVMKSGWKGDRPLYHKELAAAEKLLKYVRAISTLCKIPAPRRAKMPWRYYKIHGLSPDPCGNFRVAVYNKGRFEPDGPKQRVKYYSFLEGYYGTENFSAANLTRADNYYPAVKVHPELEWYLPPWVLIIEARDKLPMKRGALSKAAFKTLFENRMRDGAKVLFDDITELIRERTANDQYLKRFDMDLNPEPLRVPGYQLESPSLYVTRIESGDDNGLLQLRFERVDVGGGHWRMEKGQALYKFPRGRIDVIVFCIRPLTERSVRTFFSRMKSVAQKELNLNTSDPFLFVPESETSDRFATVLSEEVENFRERYGVKPAMVFLIIKDKHYLYDTFKFVLDWRYGIQSQCISIASFIEGQEKGFLASNQPDLLQFNGQMTDTKFRNIMLSINRKLGGLNIGLSGKFVSAVPPTFKLKGTMIIGLDVTHAKGALRHSIAGMVATIDMPPRTYATRLRIQEPKEEIVFDIDVMIEDLVRTFIAANPQTTLEHVLMFRDGIGDVHYLQCLKNEVPKLFEGIERAGVSPRPKMLFVVCAKRHHTRFLNRATQGDVPAGTAVNDLNYPHQQNFYLASHASVSQVGTDDISSGGNTRSTHYNVLLDEVGMSLNELQTLIYHMAYTYDASHYAIAMAPPAIYAHHVCTRARLYYQEINKARYQESTKHHWLNKPFPPCKRFLRPWAPETLQDLTPHLSIRNTMFYI